MKTLYILTGKVVIVAISSMALFYYGLMSVFPFIIENYLNESFAIFMLGILCGAFMFTVVTFVAYT